MKNKGKHGEDQNVTSNQPQVPNQIQKGRLARAAKKAGVPVKMTKKGKKT